MKNVPLHQQNKNPHLFLQHFPFKDLSEHLKEQLLTCAVQSDTAHSQAPRSIILRRVNLEKLEKLSEILIKIENILTHYFVTKADSNYEKKTGRKSCLTVPLKKNTEKSLDYVQDDTAQNLTLRSMILRGTSKHLNISTKTKPKTKLF